MLAEVVKWQQDHDSSQYRQIFAPVRVRLVFFSCHILFRLATAFVSTTQNKQAELMSLIESNSLLRFRTSEDLYDRFLQKEPLPLEFAVMRDYCGDGESFQSSDIDLTGCSAAKSLNESGSLGNQQGEDKDNHEEQEKCLRVQVHLLKPATVLSMSNSDVTCEAAAPGRSRYG